MPATAHTVVLGGADSGRAGLDHSLAAMDCALRVSREAAAAAVELRFDAARDARHVRWSVSPGSVHARPRDSSGSGSIHVVHDAERLVVRSSDGKKTHVQTHV